MLLLITGTCYYLLLVHVITYYLLLVSGPVGRVRFATLDIPAIGGVTSRGNESSVHKVMFSDFQETVNIHNNTTQLAKVSFRCLFSKTRKFEGSKVSGLPKAH